MKVHKERRPRFWPAPAVRLRRKQGSEDAARCGGRRRKPELMMEVTPVIMLHMMSGSTISFNRLRNTYPNKAMTLMTCSACERKPL